MRYPWIDEYLLQKPAVEKDLQAEWNWIRYKVGALLHHPEAGSAGRSLFAGTV